MNSSATLKGMTNTGLASYRVRRGSQLVDVDYIADAEACVFGNAAELIAHLESLLASTADEEGDITWQDRQGRTFFCGEKARAHIAAEIAAIKDGSHWSFTDTDWRADMGHLLA